MDVLPIVIAFRSTSSSHHSTSLELPFGAASSEISSGNFLPHWRCHIGELWMATVGSTRPISDTQSRFTEVSKIITKEDLNVNSFQ